MTVLYDHLGRKLRKPNQFGFVPTKPICKVDTGGNANAIGWRIDVGEPDDLEGKIAARPAGESTPAESN